MPQQLAGGSPCPRDPRRVVSSFRGNVPRPSRTAALVEFLERAALVARFPGGGGNCGWDWTPSRSRRTTSLPGSNIASVPPHIA
jgi:hypothetical protein